MLKKLLLILIILSAITVYQVYAEIFLRGTDNDFNITLNVAEGATVTEITKGLEELSLLRNSFLFRRYMIYKGYDRKIHAGEFTFTPPHTIANVAETLTQVTTLDEREITIIPGWTLNDIAQYLAKQGLATEQEIYSLLGKPAKNLDNNGTHQSAASLVLEKPAGISYEGYLAPDTYRIFVDEPIEDTLERLFSHRDEQIDAALREQIAASGRSMHEVLTMASILQKESPGGSDMPMIADLFWRRLDTGMRLQADSTVHYIFGGGQGSVFTTAAQRDSDNPWNTYKFAGLPPGPIGTPSLEAIRAAANPEPNDYWFFLTTIDTGEVKYGRTLADHNANVAKYLR